jgi:ribosomal protein L7/L12
MNRRRLLSLPFNVLLLAVAIWLAVSDGWRLLAVAAVLVTALILVGSIVGLFLPDSSDPPARYSEAGDYRVVLQVTGPKAIQVIKAIRDTRALGLREAKEMIDAAPVVVAEGLSEQSAELVADRLRAAGARALAAPIGEM